MKKPMIYTLLLISICLSLTACSKKKDKDIIQMDDKPYNILNKENMDLTELFYGEDKVLAFCVGEDGTVYTLEESQKFIRAYDTDGKIKEYPLENGMISSYLSIYEDSIYYISMDALYKLSLSSGESELLYQFEGEEFWFGGITAYKDSIFIIRKNQYDDEQADVRYDEDDVYVYEGEVLLQFDKSTRDMRIIETPNMKLMTKKSDTELLIYAYDEEEGFYFIIYDINKEEVGEKSYADMNSTHLFGITYEDTLDCVIGMDGIGLFTTKIENASKKPYFYEKGQGATNGQAVQSLNGYSYYCVDIDGSFKVVGMDNAIVMKEKPTLKAYYSYHTYYTSDFDIPDYQIEREELLYNEFATVLLAGDTDYDFIVLPSSFDFGRHVRDIGAYSPLDEVDGIEALLSQCYGYIGKASLDDQGRRWMLPIGVEVPILIYNSKMSDECGVYPEQINTYEELIHEVVSLSKDETVKYSIPYFYMMSDITSKYVFNYGILENKSYFNTDLFRKYAEIMMQYDADVANEKNIFINNVYNHHETPEEHYARVLLEMTKSTSVDYRSYNDDFHAIATPGLEEGKELKNIVDCYFIVVNPNSKNLRWVEDYLSKLSKKILNEDDSFMLKDVDYGENHLKTEIQNIFVDGEVFFEYSYEIISDELRAFRIEGKPVDEALSEMERKMDMYLNE